MYVKQTVAFDLISKKKKQTLFVNVIILYTGLFFGFRFNFKIISTSNWGVYVCVVSEKDAL